MINKYLAENNELKVTLQVQSNRISELEGIIQVTQEYNMLMKQQINSMNSSRLSERSDVNMTVEAADMVDQSA